MMTEYLYECYNIIIQLDEIFYKHLYWEKIRKKK